MTAYDSTAERSTAEVRGVTTSSLQADAAAFTITPVASLYTRSIAAAPGAFAISGQATQFAMSVDAASFAITGVSVATNVSASLGAASFSISGQATQMAMSVDPASFSISGQEVQGAPFIIADPASFSIFGGHIFAIYKVGTGLSAQYATAEKGTAEFGNPAYALTAATAVFTITGPDVLLTESPLPAHYAITVQTAQMAMPVDAAAFVISGQDALATATQVLSPGSFVITPQNIALLVLDPASFIIDAKDALLRESLERAQFVLTPVDVQQIQTIGALTAQFTITANFADLVRSIRADSATFTILGWSIQDIVGPTGDHIYLIELQAHDGTEVRTFYLSSDGFTSQPSDSPSNQYYDPRIIDPGNFEVALFDGNQLRGRGRSSSGDIRLATGDPGNGETLDDWFFYGFSQRDIRIKSLPRLSRTLSDAATLFVGKANRASSTNPIEMLDISISDRLKDLELPLLTDLFAGTTLASGATAEGNADMKGKIKQRCWGNCYNVPLQQANPFDLIFLASNGEVFSIDVYDGGLALINDGDDADLATLQAATIAGGHYRTCLALGLVRLGAAAEKTLTADVIEGNTVADRTAGQIAYRMLIAFGIASNLISTGHIAVLDGLNSAECCAFVADSKSCLTAVQDVLDSINGWMIPNVDGTFIFGRLDEPGASIQSTKNVESLSLGDQLDRTLEELPAWRVTIEYLPIFVVQGESDTFTTVSDERRGFLSEEFRTVTSEDAAVKNKHPSARDVVIRTYLTDEAAAQAECDRQLELLSVERERVNIRLPLSDAWGSNPGDSMLLEHDRLNWSGGKAFRVLRRVNQYASDEIQFSLWG